MTTNDGMLRLDAKKRVSLGRYTELAAGDFYRLTQTPHGEIVLTPLTPPKPKEQ